MAETKRGDATQAMPYRRILIIKPSSLGDIVHGLPVLAAMRKAWPQAHIAWLAGDGFAALLRGHPLIDEVISFDRRRYGHVLQSPRILADLVRFVAGLRRRRFDLVIDLQGLIRSALLGWASGAGERVGFAAARELAPLFYTRRVRCPADVVHAVEENMQIAAALGVREVSPEFPLYVPPRVVEAARELLAATAGRELREFVAVLPGARWPSKLWRAAHFAELIERMAADGSPTCVLLGATSETSIGRHIVGACEAEVVNLIGRTSLLQLVALLDLSQFVICLDSGPMHIAAGLNKPLVALFGPTSSQHTGPYSRHARVVSMRLPCAPCYRVTCPLGHHACLEALAPERVLFHVRELLAAGTPTATTGC
jgi:heptosyltransferase-1